MPSSITSIGPGAFAYCTSLTSIYIPNSVTSIGGSAFSSCSSLNSITIPNSVTSIGGSAFSGCSSLNSITIPNSVTSIGGSAFSGCSSLNSITIPNSITSIESKVFYRCSSLTSITIPNSVTSIGYDAFSGCSGLTSITIPNSVTEIGSYAFRECEKLGTLVLGDKIKEIEDYAFKECNKLYHIYCYAPEPPIADESIFTNYNVNLYVPCNYLDNYKYDRVFGSFRYIQCIESEDVTTNDVVVNPGANDVTITWPTEDNANNYTIVIEKDGEVFCTLTFNADGQLLNIAFAPGRDGNHPVQYAEQAGNGYRFTVTGLEEGTHYAYNIDVRDTANKTIKSYTGEFTTESMTAVENTHSQSPISNCQKILYEDHIYILRDGKTYTIMGAEVK
ncbi:MAG: leucine-rich repeat domain-containing protein [Paludibacteraceae bacterium]|nr:leucine-rich repeat domain-containing protein [Paludibacteraceae bacterium]